MGKGCEEILPQGKSKKGSSDLAVVLKLFSILQRKQCPSKIFFNL